MNLTHELSTEANPFGNSTAYLRVSAYIYTVVYFINVFLGIPIHSYVLWLICTGRGSGIVAEFFSLNLTVSELILCLGSTVLIVAFKFPTLLQALFLVITHPCTGRPLITCMICIERYLAVLHPVSYLKYRLLRYKLACSAVIWLIIFGFSVFIRYVLRTNDIFVFLCVYLPLYSVLLSVKGFCSLAIYQALKNSGPSEKGKEKVKANYIKRKAMSVILIITIAMCIQYAPIFVIGAFFRIMSPQQFDLFWCIGFAVSMLMAYVSPFLYIQRIQSLK